MEIMEITEILERSKRQVAAATGLKPVAVTSAARHDGGWRVRVELLEMSRIPPATDILGDYEALLDDEGALLSFERKRTRQRGESTEASE